MKIAFLAFTSLPKLGGAQIFTYNLIHYLLNQCHEIHLYLPRRYYNLISKLQINKSIKVKPILFMENSWVRFFPQILYFTLFIKQLIYRYDIWQVIGIFPAGFVSRKLSKKVPVVLRAHGDDIQKDEQLKYGLRLNKTLENKIQSTVHDVTSLVALTDTVSECYLELGIQKNKIIHIANATEIVRFQKQVNKNKIRNNLGVGNDEFMILSVGRYHKKKGYEGALIAAKILLEKGLKFKWIIIGKDLERLTPEKHKLGVEKVVSFHEDNSIDQKEEYRNMLKVPSDNLINYYKSSDLFVLPSLLETFGMVLIEAMSSGVPVITTDAPGCKDVVTHGFNGLIANKDDPISMSSNIYQILNDKILYNKLVANALIDVQKYDYSIVGNQYTDLYYSLIK